MSSSPPTAQARSKRKRDALHDEGAPLTLDTSLCVDSLDEDLVCCICHQIPLHPVETPCCGHIGCNLCFQACIERANPANGPACPSCRAVMSKDRQFHLSAFALKKISGLKMKCPLATEGCPATFMVGLQGATFARHQSECEYATVRCVDCSLEVKRKDLRIHRTESCIEREIRCQFCKLSMRFLAFDRHIKDAEHPLLGCVNRCFCEWGCLIQPDTPHASDSTATRTNILPSAQPAVNLTAASASSSSSEGSQSDGALVLPLPHRQQQQQPTTSSERDIKSSQVPSASASSSSVTRIVQIPLDESGLTEPLSKRHRTDGKENTDDEGPNDEVVFIKQLPPNGTAASTSSAASSSALWIATTAAPLSASSSVPHSLPSTTATISATAPASSTATSSSSASPTTSSLNRRTILLKSDVIRHREVCPKFPVRCGFCEDVVLPRAEIKEHVERNVFSHLTSLKSQLDKSRSAVADLKAELRQQIRYFHIEHDLPGVGEAQRRHESRVAGSGNPSIPFKMEFESREQNTGTHSFSLYSLIDGSKVGLFLKYRSGPLPVMLEFTVCVRHSEPAEDDSSLDGDEIKSIGERKHSEPDRGGRPFAKRATRYTIQDANRSVVGFSQVTTLADCERAGLYYPHEPDLESDTLTVGAVFRVLPPPTPSWLWSAVRASHNNKPSIAAD